MVAGKQSFYVLCFDVGMVGDLTGGVVLIFRFGGASIVGVSFIQATSVMSANVVTGEVVYDSGNGRGRYGCGEVMASEEYAGECLVGCRFDRFVWRNDSPIRGAV